MLQILIATSLQLTSSRFLHNYGHPDALGPQRETGADSGSEPFTCTTGGRFPNPENCSLYYYCVVISPGTLYLQNMTCPNALVFDPNSQYCTTTDNYSCEATTVTTTTTTEPSNVCEGPGFVCNSNTVYTLCADVNVPIITNEPCPSGYFCNPKCVGPCISSILAC
jgi:hypothetical protein